MDQTTYVSSIDDRVKRAKLNNVIESLNCFIDCSYNDKTVQEYGEISYCGPITLGQVIPGNKKPRRQNVPVMSTSNVYLGKLDAQGNLTVENTTQLITTQTSCTCKQASVTRYCAQAPTNCCYNDSYCWTDCVTCANIVGVNCHIICCNFYGMCGASVRRVSDNAWVGAVSNLYNYNGNELTMAATLWNGLLFVNTETIIIGCFDINNEDIILNGESVVTCGQRVLDATWPGQFYVEPDWGSCVAYSMSIRTTKCTDVCFTKCNIECAEINQSYV